jgi:prevent-host-death family protein
MQKVISAMTARKQFGQLLEESFYRGDTFVVERAGKPMAALVPIEQYQQWLTQRSEFFAQITAIQQNMYAYVPDELQALIDEAVVAVKSEEILVNV